MTFKVCLSFPSHCFSSLLFLHSFLHNPSLQDGVPHGYASGNGVLPKSFDIPNCQLVNLTNYQASCMRQQQPAGTHSGNKTETLSISGKQTLQRPAASTKLKQPSKGEDALEDFLCV